MGGLKPPASSLFNLFGLDSPPLAAGLFIFEFISDKRYHTCCTSMIQTSAGRGLAICSSCIENWKNTNMLQVHRARVQ